MGNREALPRTLTPLSDIDLRPLADTWDPMDVHLSTYLPVGTRDDERLNRSFIDTRVKAIRDVLDGDVERTFDETLHSVEDILFYDPIPGERGRVVFTSAASSFFTAYRIGVEPKRKMVLDNSPFILPLMELMDEYEDYGIILMDSHEAKVYSVRSKVLERVGSSSVDLMNRHKKGGMSQKRFNRLRRGAIEAFIHQIAEDLEGLEGLDGMRGLVVAGPGIEKRQLVDALPKHLRDMVIGVADVDIDIPRDRLLALGEVMASAHEREAEEHALAALRRAIYKDELAAVGVDQVRDALLQGRVDTLLVSEGLSVPGWVCERCKDIHTGTDGPTSCPDCGGPISGAEIVNELVEMAERTDAEVDIVQRSELLEPMGGLGAILRY